MGKVLVIAEKPSVGREIAKVLDCDVNKNGYIEGSRYIVSWAVGHIVRLADPEDYDRAYGTWSLDTLPILPDKMILKVSANTSKQYRVLKDLICSKEVDSLICATDSGREGELIFRYIYMMSGSRKPFKRLWFSSVTSAALKKAFAELKDGSAYDSLYYAAKARNEADWLVGINATRAFSLIHGSSFSIGRVQTPTLSLIVQREREIQNFKPEVFFKIGGVYNSNCSAFEALFISASENRKEDTDIPKEYIRNRKTAEKLLNAITSRDKEKWRIHSVDMKEAVEKPPLLYDLNELQADCNRLYGFTANQTLEIAQKLYEIKKAITYPRTDSRYLTNDMEPYIKDRVYQFSRVKNYSQYFKHIPSALQISKRIINDLKVTDHHAIIPTEAVCSEMSDAEFKVYDLIIRRFLCVFMNDYRFIKMDLDIQQTGTNGCFIASFKQIVDTGWRCLYDKQDDSICRMELPEFTEGSYLRLLSAKITEVTTQPPKRYTDATLLKAMETAGKLIQDEELREHMKEKGLGTPATRASIIERLIKSAYVKRKNKSLLPESKAMDIIDILDVLPEIKSPELTGEWEKKLHMIQEGTMQFDDFLEQINDLTIQIVEKASGRKVRSGVKNMLKSKRRRGVVNE